MIRWAGVIGMGLLATLLAIVLLRPSASVIDAQRAETLAAGLRCPDCQGLSVADSHTASAVEIRRQVDELLAGGATDDGVRDHFVARYGEWVLLAPSQPLFWIVPFVVVGLGAALLVFWIARRREDPALEPAVEPALGEDERHRLHDEAEALDA